MRETIIIIIVLILILSSSYGIQKYLNRTADELLEMLKNLKEEAIKTKENDNRKELIKQSQKIADKWDKTENIWAIIILHDELDLIETSLTKMNSSIKHGEIVESLEELENAIFLINHIKQKEKFSLKNIF